MAKILYADDSATARSMAKSILAEAGHEVLTVNSAEEARVELAEFAPDVVMLDVFMGGTASGLELAHDVRESAATHEAPLVLAIGKMENIEQEQLQSVKPDGVVTKPLETGELTKCVASVLESTSNRAKADYRGLRSAVAQSAVPQLWPAAAIASIYAPVRAASAQSVARSAKETQADLVAIAVARVIERMMPTIVQQVKSELGTK